jgi:hypothetical protein
MVLCCSIRCGADRRRIRPEFPNFQSPFFKVELPKNSRAEKPTRFATLEHTLAMIEVLNHNDQEDKHKKAMMQSAARVIAMAAFSRLRKSESKGSSGATSMFGALLGVPRLLRKAERPKRARARSSDRQRNGFPDDGYVFAERCLFAHRAEVAQLVEQPIRNRQVIGSSPILGSIPFRISSGRIFQSRLRNSA